MTHATFKMKQNNNSYNHLRTLPTRSLIIQPTPETDGAKGRSAKEEVDKCESTHEQATEERYKIIVRNKWHKVRRQVETSL